ncbi:MAG: tetratricopeptide repeat protein [Nitrospirota bacterium]
MTGFHRAALVVLLFATVFAYHGALRNGFVWDDSHTIVNNRAIDSLKSMPSWFTRPETWSARFEASYRPVITASFGLDVALWGRNPARFHAVNIAIHLSVILLTSVLAIRLWGQPWSAVLAAGLVALHPINAEAVNYVSARSSLLSTFFTLGAVAAWARWSDGRPAAIRWLAASLILGGLALGTKETSVVLPLLIIVWDRATSDRERSFAATIRQSLPWWGLISAYLAWRTFILSGSQTERLIDEGIWQPALFAIKIFLTSLWSWFVPIGSAVDHGWLWRIAPTEGAVLVGGILVAAIATLVVYRFDRRIGWCVAWFWVSLLPLAALPLISRVTLYQDHRVYLAGIGLAWAGGEVFRRIGHALVSRPPLGVGAGVLTAALTSLAVAVDAARTSVWRDADRLWAHTLDRYPTSVLARNHQGMRWLEAGETTKARDAFEQSAALAPDFAVTHNYLGIAYAQLGDLDRAIAEFTTAVRLSPLFINARLNLGNAYERTGRWDLALAAYEQGIPDEPWVADLLERAAKLLTRMGRRDEALARYQRILLVEPNHRAARAAIGQSAR